MIKIKTILGIEVDLKKLELTDLHENDETLTKIKKDELIKIIYNLACEYGHIEIVKKYIELKSGDLDINEINKAIASPNRAILKYLQDSCDVYDKLKNIFKQFQITQCYEQKISFI
jgi:hypothetical protein